jgi:uncharacterized membrane protein YgcG
MKKLHQCMRCAKVAFDRKALVCDKCKPEDTTGLFPKYLSNELLDTLVDSSPSTPDSSPSNTDFTPIPASNPDFTGGGGESGGGGASGDW